MTQTATRPPNRGNFTATITTDATETDAAADADTAVIDANPVTIEELDERAAEVEAAWLSRQDPLNRMRHAVGVGTYALLVSVTAQEVSLDDQGEPETRTDVTVEAVVKSRPGAPALPEPLAIRTKGGQVGEISMTVSHEANLRVGDRYLVLPNEAQIMGTINRLGDEQLLRVVDDQYVWRNGQLVLSSDQLQAELLDLGKDLQ